MSIIITNRTERKRFFRFAIVGSLGAAVDFVVYNIFISIFSTSVIIAGTISFLAAVLNNFFLNRTWTYQDSRSKQVPRQLVEFFIVSLVGLGLRIPLLAIINPLMQDLIKKIGYALSLPLNLQNKQIGNNITLAIIIIIVLFWNFFANRYWTYNDVS